MHKAKILVIDDDVDIRTFSKSILEKTKKFEVKVSSGAVEGIMLAKTYKPDLILLDIVMPNVDGTAAARYLAGDSLTKNIPVAFITSLAKQEDVEAGAGVVGGHFFIAKPVSSAGLINQVESILLTVSGREFAVGG